jgi:uncharacterized protein with WD repeat
MASASDQTAAARAARWVGKSADDRRRETANARRAQAVREVVENWPELTDEQQNRLRSILRPPEGGGRHERP